MNNQDYIDTTEIQNAEQLFSNNNSYKNPVTANAQGNPPTPPSTANAQENPPMPPTWNWKIDTPEDNMQAIAAPNVPQHLFHLKKVNTKKENFI